MKKLKLYLYINLILAIIFTFLTLSFNADVSIFAFILSAVFDFFFFGIVYKDLLKNKSCARISSIYRFFQYEPFVYISSFVIQRSGKNSMPYLLDFISAIIWVLVLISSFFILYYLRDKRVYNLCPEWQKDHKNSKEKKYHGMKRVGIEILEWVDAFVQAIFTILLINIFFFQLYEIPSESMVPTFLIKDRVVVVKTPAGPKFPLSNVGLPHFQKYNRGDIVVFHNPHYGNNHKDDVKSVFAQFIQMATLTLVNINTDDNGELKADPLVKRVTGVPGEQLIMMDGVLYARTAENDEFKAVEDYSCWNLNELSSSTKSRIKYFPLNSSQVEKTLAVENDRRNLNLLEAADECRKLSSQFDLYFKGNMIDEAKVASLIDADELYELNLFNNNDDITVTLLTKDGGSQWFRHFMCDWIDTVDNLENFVEDGAIIGKSLAGGDLYSDSLFRLNVMVKLVFGNIVLKNVESITSESTVARNQDNQWKELFGKASDLHMYLVEMDLRNMPLFPANNSNGDARFIPDDCYFMMGDNRYNSLDMRHSYEVDLVPLWRADSYSVRSYSRMNQQYVSKDKILGKASFRFWPLDRVGVVSK